MHALMFLHTNPHDVRWSSSGKQQWRSGVYSSAPSCADSSLHIGILVCILKSTYLIACLFADSSRRAFYKEFMKVVDAADVIIEVLDARDPLSCRCLDVERLVRRSGADKKVILLLNKIGQHLQTVSASLVRLLLRRSGWTWHR